MRRLQARVVPVCCCRSISLGVAISPAEVARVKSVPVEMLSSLVKPAVISWTKIDSISRQKLAPLVNSIGNTQLSAIASKVEGNPPKQVSTDGKVKFTTTDFKSAEELITLYETILYPARVAKKEYDVLELQSFHIKDDLKRGLSAFKQAYLDKEKVRLEEIKKAMKVKKDFIKKIGADNFSTEVCNDLVNVLRIAGQSNEDCRLLAVKVLEDMTFLEVPFNEITQQLLKNVTFGDGPFDDSSLLFSCVEYPERGEISASSAPLEEIADDALDIISRRHQTPLDSGILLRQGDTHPMLQRSAE